MALEFKNIVYDPKIDIIGKEVPLQALEKTGDVLQGRYDKSYEQFSLADEALKQMEAGANEVDRQRAKELREAYKQEMQGILAQGDFHNMRHQTASLARNAAVNYKNIAEKNAKIEAGVNAIRKDPRYALDPEGAVQEYLKNLKSISINPETKTVSDLNVENYGAAADVDKMKWSITYGAVMKPTIDKVKGTSTVGVDRFGKEVSDPNQAVMLMTKTKSGQLVKLEPDEIEKTLLPAAYADPNIQAELNRNVKRAGYDPNTEEGKLYKEKLFKEQTLPAIKAAAGLLRRDEDMSAETVGFHNMGGSGDSDGMPPNKLGKLLVASTQTSGEAPPDIKNPKTNPNLPQDLVQKGILGDFGSGWKPDSKESKEQFNMLIEAIDDGISNAKNPEEKQKFQNSKKMFNDYRKLMVDFPEYRNTLSEIQSREPGYAVKNLFDKFGAGVESIGSLFANKERLKDFETRKRQIETQYGNVIGRGFTDTDVEKQIQNYWSNGVKPVSTGIKMISTSGSTKNMNDEFKNLSNVILPQDITIYKADKGFNPNGNMEFVKVSTEPRGNGDGHLFEVKQTDKEGNVKTGLVHINEEGYNDALQNMERAIWKDTREHIPLSTNNKFKQTRPFNRVGEARPVFEILEENNLSGPEGSELRKVYKSFKDGQYKDVTIKKTEQGYVVPGLKEIITDPETGKRMYGKQDQVFSSYIQALNELISE
jgi:hypothetical protein